MSSVFLLAPCKSLRCGCTFQKHARIRFQLSTHVHVCVRVLWENVFDSNTVACSLRVRTRKSHRRSGELGWASQTQTDRYFGRLSRTCFCSDDGNSVLRSRSRTWIGFASKLISVENALPRERYYKHQRLQSCPGDENEMRHRSSFVILYIFQLFKFRAVLSEQCHVGVFSPPPPPPSPSNRTPLFLITGLVFPI